MGGDPDVRPERTDEMKGPGDEVRLLLTVLLAGWVLAYGYSLVELRRLGPTDELIANGFAFTPAMSFLGWQGIAGLLALAIYGVSRLWPNGSATRQICGLPLLLAFLLILGIAALLVLGNQP